MTKKHESRTLLEAMETGTAVHVDLWYPRIDPIKHIYVGLVDVRAADNIRISYDFERDGWVIEQASVFEWNDNDKVCDPDWQEVAFVQSWARDTSKG
jgi:hypothetical protein